MLERLAPFLSGINLLYTVVVIYVIVTITKWTRDEIKIRRLGGHAPVRRTWLPLGADFVYEAIIRNSHNENLQFWDDNFIKYGNPENPHTIEANGGGRRMIMTADHENIKAILATQFNDFGKGETFHADWEEFLGDGIFSTDHELWHHSRQLIRPQFVKDRVSDLKIFEKHVDILMKKLGTSGKTVDVRDLFFRYTLDAATEFLLGRSVGSLEIEGEHEFAHAFAEIQRIQTLWTRAGPIHKYFPRAEFRKHLKVLNDFVDPFIDDALRLSPEELEKRTKAEAGYSFLHAVASYTRDRKVLRDQIVSVLLAGRDTTACTLSWIFYELSKQDSIVQNLRAEIENVVGLERAPTYADLKGMKYLQYTMNEALRLYPVVPFNVRSAMKDTTIPRGGGPKGDQPVGVLKGTPIGYSTQYMQLTSRIYPSPSESPDLPSPLVFAPERWEKWQPKSWTYIPFNGGPRICVGQQFALTEMGYTIVRMLQRYRKIESREHEGGGQSAKRAPPPPTYGAPSMPRQMADSRALPYLSEIVLSPADKVRVAFYESYEHLTKRVTKENVG